MSDSSYWNGVAEGNFVDDEAARHRVPNHHGRHLSLVSTDSGGGQLSLGSFDPSITNNARYVSFITYGDFQIHLKDLSTGDLMLVSSDAQGDPGNSGSGAISQVFKVPGGDVSVAFDSAATNLVPNDTNGHSDVFIKDVRTDTVILVSTDSQGQQGDGDSGAAAVSGDGHHVAFQSSAGNFMPASAGPPREFSVTTDIYVKDLDTGQLTLVSADAQGHQATGPESAYFGASFGAPISWDGTKVAFTSNATNLVEGDTNGQPDVFVKDLSTGAVTLVSSDSQGHGSNGFSSGGALSADGRYSVFTSNATNLSKGTDGTPEVYLKDLATGHVTLVSVDSQGHPANGFSGDAAISPNGRYVAFDSAATNLASGATSGTSNVYVRDMLTGSLTLVSVDAAGHEGNSNSSEPQVTNRGAVVFASDASNLVPNDTNGLFDIFVSTQGHGHDPWM